MSQDNILFSTNPSNDLDTFIIRKKYSKLMVIGDENTIASCYHKIKESLPPHAVVQVKSGEEEKNIQTCMVLWQAMTDQMLDRHACILILGGGVLGDMAGFCASTYKRGIDFILIPTTLLSQADASIGGKLGIDFNHFKNHIGVFQQPALTLLHSGFLDTLPKNELRSGFAEVIKHTLIADKPMWQTISELSLEQQSWDTLVKHSVKFKARVTTEDPKEKGLRKILNAGHTIGHALESHLLNTGNRILHGEAIAAGLIAESFIAWKRDFLVESDLDEIRTYIVRIFGKVSIEDDAMDSVCRLIIQDKKNKDNRILCVLLNGIGDAKWDIEISLDEVRNALRLYRSL